MLFVFLHQLKKYIFFCSDFVSRKSYKRFLRTRLSFLVFQEIRNSLRILQIVRQEAGSLGRKRKYSSLVNFESVEVMPCFCPLNVSSCVCE